MRRSRILLLVVALGWFALPLGADEGRPLLVTVDDLTITPSSLHPDPDERARITEEMLAVLKRHEIPAVGFVTWRNVTSEADKRLLQRWLDEGHELGNHSTAHLSYTETDPETYIADVENARRKITEILEPRGQRVRFFRFPFLREGSTLEKLNAMRAYLEESGQRNLPVTIDNQDWSFNRPWVEARRAGDAAGMQRVAEAYHESLRVSVRHHERTSRRLFERDVPQVVLLHAMEVSAAQWDRLFTWLKDQGYRFANADEVLADPAFDEPHNYVGTRGPSRWDRLLAERWHSDAEEEVRALIKEQVASWNRGDQEGFCAYYTEDTVFLAPSGVRRGRAQVLERYQTKYPDRASQGDLTIEVLDFLPHSGTEISMLGDARPGRVHSATVAGRWTLRYPGQPDKETATGLTLMVFARDEAGDWKIVRDASM